YSMNRRIPNGTYGGVRGRGLAAPSYSIEAILIRQAILLLTEHGSPGKVLVFTNKKGERVLTSSDPNYRCSR
ncbi:hypothetical protein, partial [Paenibacillus sp. sgz500958]|uniref:hypothetical protein n=1 Tax=Paenibacillus sp. sgz500958 TaxID=3242475 RepID=UPI0036D279BE